MAEAVVTIEGVYTNGPYNGKFGEFHRYDVKGGGKKFQTIKDAVAEQAKSLKGQTAKVTYHEESRGEYTNLVIDSIESAGGTAAPVQSSDERQLQIMRQSGLERAIRFANLGLVEVGDVGDLYAISDAFVDYFQNGAPQLAEEKNF